MDRRKELDNLFDGGIKVDQDHMMKTISSQFPNEKRAGVELVLNETDAGATEVHISGSEHGGRITMKFAGNGHGMNGKELDTFITLFRSAKRNPDMAIGKFGIGGKAVAAFNGQSCLEVKTSTGKEAWHLKTGSIPSQKQGLNGRRMSRVDSIGQKWKSYTIQAENSSSTVRAK